MLMFFAGIAAVLFSYRVFEYWGGALLEIAVLAVIGVDLCLKSRTAGILVETNQKMGVVSGTKRKFWK